MLLKRSFIFLLCLGLIFTVKTNAFHLQNEAVEPIEWEELVSFLIDVPGYEKHGEPEGETVSMMNQQWSRVSQEYRSEKDDTDLEIEIVDSAGIPMIMQQFKSVMGLRADTSEEHVEQINIKGFPAVEIYEYDDQSAELVILIEDRFVVHLEGAEYQDTTQIKEISKKMDLQGIADLGQKTN